MTSLHNNQHHHQQQHLQKHVTLSTPTSHYKHSTNNTSTILKSVNKSINISVSSSKTNTPHTQSSTNRNHSLFSTPSSSSSSSKSPSSLNNRSNTTTTTSPSSGINSSMLNYDANRTYGYFTECPNLQEYVMDFFSDRFPEEILHRTRQHTMHIQQKQQEQQHREEIEERCEYISQYVEMIYFSICKHKTLQYQKQTHNNHFTNNNGRSNSSTTRENIPQNTSIHFDPSISYNSKQRSNNSLSDHTYDMYCDSLHKEISSFLIEQYLALSQYHEKARGKLLNNHYRKEITVATNKNTTQVNVEQLRHDLLTSLSVVIGLFKDLTNIDVNHFSTFIHKYPSSTSGERKRKSKMSVRRKQKVSQTSNSSPKKMCLNIHQPDSSTTPKVSANDDSGEKKDEDLFIQLMNATLFGVQFFTLALSLALSSYNRQKYLVLAKYLSYEAHYCFLVALSILAKTTNDKTKDYGSLLTLFEGDEFGNSLLYASYQCYVCVRLKEKGMKGGDDDLLSLWSKFTDCIEKKVQLMMANKNNEMKEDEICSEAIFQYNQAIVHLQFALQLKSVATCDDSCSSAAIDCFHKCAICCEKNADALFFDQNRIESNFYGTMSEAYRGAGRSYLYASEEGKLGHNEERKALIASADLFLQKIRCVQEGREGDDESTAYYFGKAAFVMVSAFHAYQEARKSSHMEDITRVWLKTAVACELQSKAIIEGRLDDMELLKKARAMLGNTSSKARQSNPSIDTAATVYQRLFEMKEKQRLGGEYNDVLISCWQKYGFHLEKCGSFYLINDLENAKKHELALSFLKNDHQVDGAIGCFQHSKCCSLQQLPFLSECVDMWNLLCELFIEVSDAIVKVDWKENRIVEQGSIILSELLSNERDIYSSAYGILERVEEEVIDYGNATKLECRISPKEMKEMLDLTKALMEWVKRIADHVLSAIATNTDLDIDEDLEVLRAYRLTLHAIFRLNNITREYNLQEELVNQWFTTWSKSKTYGKQLISALRLNKKATAAKMFDLCSRCGGLPSDGSGAGFYFDQYFKLVQEDSQQFLSPPSSPDDGSSSSSSPPISSSASLITDLTVSASSAKSTNRQKYQSYLKKANQTLSQISVLEKRLL